MSLKGEISVGLSVLDHQLIDCDGRRCGKVDDIELQRDEKGNLYVSALLTGPRLWRVRARILGRLLARLSKSDSVRIPYDQIEEVTFVVTLSQPAKELGLGRGDDRAGRWIGKLPKA